MKTQIIPNMLFLSFLCGTLLFGCGAQGGGAEPKKRILAPQFSVTDMNGRAISLADFKGKVVFLDFWATWCSPCIWSSPQVEALAEKYDNKKVVVLSVSLDANSAAVKRFFEGRNVKTVVALAGNSGVDVKYRVDGIPAFYLIDQEGFLVKRWGGYNENIAASWQREIDSLLK